MFKIVHTVYYNSAENRRSGFELYSTEPTFNEQLITRLQQEIEDQNPVIVVDSKAQLPPFWQPRLLQAMAENDAIMKMYEEHGDMEKAILQFTKQTK